MQTTSIKYCHVHLQGNEIFIPHCKEENKTFVRTASNKQGPQSKERCG